LLPCDVALSTWSFNAIKSVGGVAPAAAAPTAGSIASETKSMSSTAMIEARAAA
jgi:hypothetical protein